MFYKSACITDNIDTADASSNAKDELAKGEPKPSHGREKKSFDRLVIHLLNGFVSLQTFLTNCACACV